MKILFTGKATKGAGSWRMRGEQLASTRAHWKAVPNATGRDFEDVDVVVLIKRAPKAVLKEIHNWGGPFIYDALDFWKQPEDALDIKTPVQAQKKFRKHFERINADIVLATNSVMRHDLIPITNRTEVLYHHFDPNVRPDFFKRKSKIIAYWGRSDYLGSWKRIVSRACSDMGYEFVIWPRYMNEAAAMFAVRGGYHGSWLARRWKSGVKASTAMALGIPFIAWPEESYVETCGKYLYHFKNEEMLLNQISKAMDERHNLEPTNEFSVEKCANHLENIALNI